jgi:hypothetical protein
MEYILDRFLHRIIKNNYMNIINPIYMPLLKKWIEYSCKKHDMYHDCDANYILETIDSLGDSVYNIENMILIYTWCMDIIQIPN